MRNLDYTRWMEPLARPVHASPVAMVSLVVLLWIATGGGTAFAQVDESDAGIDTILDLINEARSTEQQCGDEMFAAQPPLEWSDPLETAANAHVQDMSERDFFSHTNPDGESSGDRIRSVSSAFQATGENIARGQSNAEQVMESWMSSPGHCANIMSDSFTHVAVGAAMGTMERNGNQSEALHWTMKLGRER